MSTKEVSAEQRTEVDLWLEAHYPRHVSLHWPTAMAEFAAHKLEQENQALRAALLRVTESLEAATAIATGELQGMERVGTRWRDRTQEARKLLASTEGK